MSRLNTKEFKNKNFYRIERLINNAFLRMFNNGETDINVNKLCIEADVNRTTFYDHYKSIDDLYNNLFENAFHCLTDWVNDEKKKQLFYSNPKELFKSQYDCIMNCGNNYKILKALVRSNNLLPVLNRISDFYTDLIVKKLKNENKEVSEEGVIYFKTTILGCYVHLFMSAANPQYKYSVEKVIHTISNKILNNMPH